MLVRFVDEGVFSRGYKIVCAMCMQGTWVTKSLVVSSFSSASASLLPLMLVCASYYLDGNFMLEPCDEVYHGGYKETNITNNIIHMQ